MKKRVFSIFLSLCMVMALLPTVALAADQTEVSDLSGLQTALTSGATSIKITNKIEISSGEVNLSASSPVTITAEVADLFAVTGGSLTLGKNLTFENNSTILYVTGGSATIAGANLYNSSPKNPTVHATGTGVTLTVTGGEIKAKAEADSQPGDVALLVEKGATATVTGGTIYAAGNNALVAAGNSTVTVSGGTVECGTGHPYSAAAATTKQNGGTGESAELKISDSAIIKGGVTADTAGSSVIITGGTFKNSDGSAMSASDLNGYLAEGLTLDENGAVAQEETEVSTLEQLQTALSEGKTDIKITQAITISSGEVNLSASSPVTITAEVADLFTVTGGSLTLSKNLTFENNSTILWVTGGSATIAGANLYNSSPKNPTVHATGTGVTLTVTGGEIKAKAEADSQPGDVALLVEKGATATVTGGTIYAAGNNALVAAGGSTVTVSGGTVECGTGHPYSAAAATTKQNGGTGESAELKISDSAIIKGGVTADTAGSSVIITGGTFKNSNGTAMSASDLNGYLAEGLTLDENGTVVEEEAGDNALTITTASVTGMASAVKVTISGETGKFYTIDIKNTNYWFSVQAGTNGNASFIVPDGTMVGIYEMNAQLSFDEQGAPTNTTGRDYEGPVSKTN